MGYMFPSQTARLLGTHEGEEALPVLVKIPVTERLLQENPPLKPEGEFGGRRVLYENVPADMITDVAVYAQINGVQGWYRVTLKEKAFRRRSISLLKDGHRQESRQYFGLVSCSAGRAALHGELHTHPSVTLIIELSMHGQMIMTMIPA